MIDETLLDDEVALAGLDSRGVLLALADAGAQVRRATTLAAEAGIERVGFGERPRSVVVAGLGTTTVAAQLLAALADTSAPVPFSVRTGGPLPAWVGPMDLVVALSLSGRAPGPLDLAAQAARRGCALLTVGAPDSPLADVCAQARGVHVPVPADVQSSRTGLWSLLTPVLIAADGLDLVRLGSLDPVADRLDARAYECRPSSAAFVNPAKSLALALGDTVPAVLGDGPLTGVAASRGAAMLARTGRMPVSHGELPDAAAQIVATFAGPFTAGAGEGTDEPHGGRDIFADPFLDGPSLPPLGLALLRTPDAVTARLTDAVAEQARAAGVRVQEVTATGGDGLEQVADLVALLDFAATYTALGHGLDPGRSPHVDELRRLG